MTLNAITNDHTVAALFMPSRGPYGLTAVADSGRRPFDQPTNVLYWSVSCGTLWFVCSACPLPCPSPNGRGVDAALYKDDYTFIGVYSLSLWERQGRGQRTWITITVKILRLSTEKGSIALRRRNWFMRHTMRIVGTYSRIIPPRRVYALRDAAEEGFRNYRAFFCCGSFI